MVELAAIVLASIVATRDINGHRIVCHLCLLALLHADCGVSLDSQLLLEVLLGDQLIIQILLFDHIIDVINRSLRQALLNALLLEVRRLEVRRQRLVVVLPLVAEHDILPRDISEMAFRPIVDFSLVVGVHLDFVVVELGLTFQ